MAVEGDDLYRFEMFRARELKSQFDCNFRIRKTTSSSPVGHLPDWASLMIGLSHGFVD